MEDFERRAVRARVQLDSLEQTIGKCKRCPLHKSRENLVFGGGNPDAPIMLISGTVLWSEDRSGRVLDGDHGNIVARAMSEVGLDVRQDIYACTALKCQRPYEIKDGERRRADPPQSAMDTCIPFLRWQIEIVNPAIVIVQGKLAGVQILGESRPFVMFSGSWRSFGKKRVAFATHNPAGLFGERAGLQSEYLQHWHQVAQRLDCLGRLWKPDAACFRRGWSYQGVSNA
jgi:DNA polymerase